MKKIVVFIVLLLFTLTGSIVCYAADYQTYDVASARKICTLQVQSNDATCYSSYIDTSGDTVTITITQSLEKKGLLWIWNTADGTWVKEVNSNSASFTNLVENLDSGTYRVKTIFAIETKTGATEEITMYSSEVSIS